jgi:Ca-activated chloride channel family protein
MLELAHPWVLAAILPLAVLWIRRGSSPSPVLNQFLGPMGPGTSLGQSGSFPDRTLRAVILVLLLVLLAEPRSREIVPPPPEDGLVMVVALDVSGSMALEYDRGPSRLAMAKQEISRFIQARPFDRIGLVTFGTDAATRVPPTTRHAHLLEVLDEVRVEGPDEGTALGMGLGLAALSALEVPAPSRIVVLLTDGRSNRGTVEPLSAADAAGVLGVRIHAVGVGESEGEDPLDESLLRAVVGKAEGLFFRAHDARGLREVLSELGEMEIGPMADSAGFTFRSHHRGLILAVLLLLVLEAVGRALPRGRVG